MCRIAISTEALYIRNLESDRFCAIVYNLESASVESRSAPCASERFGAVP